MEERRAASRWENVIKAFEAEKDDTERRASTVQEPNEALIHEMREIFHISDGGDQNSLPDHVLNLTNISDHLPFPVSYNINGITINVVSWNIMVNKTIRIDDQTKKRNILSSIKYYIKRLLGGDNIHILLFQEYNWNPSSNQLAPPQLLGKVGSRVDVSQWGLLHSYGNLISCGPGLLTYYKKIYLEEHNIRPYVIFNPELQRPARDGGGHLAAPYFEQDNPDRTNIEKNLVLILDFEGKENILVLQNIHRRCVECFDYTKHIFSYFGNATPGVIMPWSGRPESVDAIPFPIDKNVAVSIIGDFNYAPHAFRGAMRTTPVYIQSKIDGDYSESSSFGNYLFNHSNGVKPSGRLDDYKNIIFSDIKQYNDDNIRAALFQATDSVTLNIVQVFSDSLLNARMTQTDILQTRASSTQGNWRSRRSSPRSRSTQGNWQRSKGRGYRRKKSTKTLGKKSKTRRKKRLRSIRRQNNNNNTKKEKIDEKCYRVLPIWKNMERNYKINKLTKKG